MTRGSRKPSEIFRSVLRNAEEELALASNKAGTFKHTGIRGDERASALIQFLKQHLPTSYGVGKGEAVDYRDGRSGQLDIMIYDKAGSAPVYGGDENFLIPCEALYAVIEVKTTLTQTELNKSYKAAQKVRSLKPFKNKFVGPRRDGSPVEEKNSRCIFSLFAYKTDLSKDNWLMKEYIRVKSAALELNSGVDLIERIVVLGRGMINPCSGHGKICEDDDQGIFLEYYLHLVNFLNRENGRRAAVDWQNYSGRTSKGWKAIKDVDGC